MISIIEQLKAAARRQATEYRDIEGGSIIDVIEDDESRLVAFAVPLFSEEPITEQWMQEKWSHIFNRSVSKYFSDDEYRPSWNWHLYPDKTDSGECMDAVQVWFGNDGKLNEVTVPFRNELPLSKGHSRP